MREAEFERRVLQLAARYHLFVYHPHMPLYDNPGWPDLAIIGSRAALFRELKADRGVLTRAQQDVGERMRAAGLDWDVWRPADLSSDRIDEELAALSGEIPWCRL